MKGKLYVLISQEGVQKILCIYCHVRVITSPITSDNAVRVLTLTSQSEERNCESLPGDLLSRMGRFHCLSQFFQARSGILSSNITVVSFHIPSFHASQLSYQSKTFYNISSYKWYKNQYNAKLSIGLGGKAFDLYSEDARFESLTKHLLLWDVFWFSSVPPGKFRNSTLYQSKLLFLISFQFLRSLPSKNSSWYSQGYWQRQMGYKWTEIQQSDDVGMAVA
jgi:hypothetical protein